MVSALHRHPLVSISIKTMLKHELKRCLTSCRGSIYPNIAHFFSFLIFSCVCWFLSCFTKLFCIATEAEPKKRQGVMTSPPLQLTRWVAEKVWEYDKSMIKAPSHRLSIHCFLRILTVFWLFGKKGLTKKH